MDLIRLEGITKTFPGVKALDGVSLSVKAGEILALVGENGAGKSTLMKILSGTYKAGTFEGRITLRGHDVQFHNPADAEKAGIAIIHQELSAFRHLSVAENMFAGHWPQRFGLVDWAALETEASKWLKIVGAPCGPNDRMGDLSVGTQQMVEIAKALSRKTEILILDEPTSALTEQEVDRLFGLLKQLKTEGKALIYISHKMKEIYSLCERITVLRDGLSVHTAMAKDFPEDELVSKMVGRPLNRLFPESPKRSFGAELLRVEDFEGRFKNGKLAFGPVSFVLKEKEILGFGGLLGAGRTELMQALFGDPRIKTTGKVWIKGKLMGLSEPRQSLRQHIAFIPEDRKQDSILGVRSLNENLSLSRLVEGRLNSILKNDEENKSSNQSLQSLRVRATGPAQLIQELSGGNQQKVIFGRALQTKPEIIFLDEPTRGVDVGAKYEIYEILFKLASEGQGLLLVSSDLVELMAMSDRIVVLTQGRFGGELSRAEFSQTEIMKRAISSETARQIT